MQRKEDENGRFVFSPSQFLTTSQIKSYFSRSTHSRRRSSQSQLVHDSALADDDELAAEGAENEFDAIQAEIYQESIRSIAEDRFREIV